MSKTLFRSRLAWEERWTRPTTELLLEPQKEQNLKLIPLLVDGINTFPGVRQDLVWFSTAWKWTWQFSLPEIAANNGEQRDKLAYIVPNPEQLLVSVPLYDDLIAAMPIKRLNRYVREAIRTAQCAVKIHWIQFTPTAQTEVEHILDLVKRKHKLLTRTDKAKG